MTCLHVLSLFDARFLFPGFVKATYMPDQFMMFFCHLFALRAIDDDWKKLSKFETSPDSNQLAVETRESHFPFNTYLFFVEVFLKTCSLGTFLSVTQPSPSNFLNAPQKSFQQISNQKRNSFQTQTW